MMGVEGPFPSKGLPVVRTRFGKSASKGNKSFDSVKSDDSLTSLEWLSTMGNPTTPVLHASVYPNSESQNYNIQDLISLAFSTGAETGAQSDRDRRYGTAAGTALDEGSYFP